MLRFTGSKVVDQVERVQRADGAAARLPWWRGWCDVEALLVWAVCDQRVGLGTATAGLCELEARAAGLEWRASSSDGVAAVGRIGEVGCRIDVSGPGREVVHPVAEAVAVALDASAERGLLLHYARSGRAPDGWREREVWLRPESWSEPGEAATWVYAERTIGAYCPVMVVPEELAEAGRAEYVRWWLALADLAWALQARPLGFELLREPGRAREPWLQKGGCERGSGLT